MENDIADEKVKQTVRQTYETIARRFAKDTRPASCCGG